jgi:hypothetical protein
MLRADAGRYLVVAASYTAAALDSVSMRLKWNLARAAPRGRGTWRHVAWCSGPLASLHSVSFMDGSTAPPTLMELRNFVSSPKNMQF